MPALGIGESTAADNLTGTNCTTWAENMDLMIAPDLVTVLLPCKDTVTQVIDSRKHLIRGLLTVSGGSVRFCHGREHGSRQAWSWSRIYKPAFDTQHESEKENKTGLGERYWNITAHGQCTPSPTRPHLLILQKSSFMETKHSKMRSPGSPSYKPPW